MPKRKTHKKKFSVSRKSAFIGIAAAMVTLLFAAQLWFNLYIWDVTQQQSAFQMRTLIVDAIRGLDELKESPVDGQRIPEARVILPEETNDVKNLRYVYNESLDTFPASLEISTVDLSLYSQSVLNAPTVEKLFDKVPEVQACNRGFSVYFGDPKLNEHDTDIKLVTKKKLADGREIQLVREKKCGNNKPNTDGHMRKEMMDSLEKHLLQIQSY